MAHAVRATAGDHNPARCPTRRQRVMRLLRDVPKMLATVAKHLGVSRATVYQLCERGELQHTRVSNAIRVPKTVLVAYLRQRSVEAR